MLALEIGDVRRFDTAGHLGGYARLTPAVHSSGGHTRMKQVGQTVNRTPKRAFVEAAQKKAVRNRNTSRIGHPAAERL